MNKSFNTLFRKCYWTGWFLGVPLTLFGIKAIYNNLKSAPEIYRINNVSPNPFLRERQIERKSIDNIIIYNPYEKEEERQRDRYLDYLIYSQKKQIDL